MSRLIQAKPPTTSAALVENEPRILDTDLAEKLGCDRPADIRELIKRHETPLATMGVIRTVRKTSGPQGGHPTEAYYLNKPQAIFITTQTAIRI